MDAARAIRDFLAFVDALDSDPAGNRVCREDRPTLETKLDDVCEACNKVRRLLILRLPANANHVIELPDMPEEDRELFDYLSQVLWASPVTRYTPDGRLWLEAVRVRSFGDDAPPVGTRMVEADRIRKLRAIADYLLPVEGSRLNARKLSIGETDVFNRLKNRVLTPDQLALEMTTTRQVVINHVKAIRDKRGRDVVQMRTGVGYFRPDAQPEWNNVKVPRRRKRIRPAG